jgi:hypothetical protein
MGEFLKGRSMKTDALVQALADQLAAHQAKRRWGLGPRLFMVVLLSAVPSFLIIWFGASRTPYGGTTTILFTFGAAIVLAVLAFIASLTLSRPEATASSTMLFIPPVLILLAGVVGELATFPKETWLSRLVGAAPLPCFVCVVSLSLPILLATLLVLRSGAPARPRLAGTAAGLLAGGVSLALYTVHCPENSLLYVAAWPVSGVIFVALLGAIVGGRVLRW